MDDLTGRMHPAIGAPRTDRDDGLARNERDGCLHGILNGNRVILRLPASVVGAVIFDDGGDAAALELLVQGVLAGQSLDQPLGFLFLTG